MTETLIGCIVCKFLDEGIIIGEPEEGSEITARDAALLVSAAESRYEGPWALVSNRVNSFSVDFETYRVVDQTPNLKALAVVAYRTNSHPVASAEALYLRRTPFAVFEDLDDAVDWARKHVKA